MPSFAVAASAFARSLLAVLLSFSMLASPAVAPSAAAQDSTSLDTVSAEYHDLLELFYRPLDGGDLLRAGWLALRDDAPRHGATPPGPLPELSLDPDTAFQTFAAVYSSYVATLPASMTAAVAAADVATGMADSVHEQHTHYLPPSLMQSFLELVAGSHQATGLGVSLASAPPGLIAGVAPDGPAARAGIQPGDVLLAADGKDLSGADGASIASKLTGPDGSPVALTIDRGAGPQTITVTRGPFYFPPLESRLLPDGTGYIRLSDFVISGTTLPDGTEVLSDFDRRLDELDAAGARALIFDLRDNGGGSVQTADELLGVFLPEDARSVREFDQRGHESYELAGGRLRARQLPMAVMINGGSASASEVTAAALREQHRAILVGERSAGAVASSELLPLPGGSGLQVAVAAATTAETQTELDGVGITPDVSATQRRTLADYRSGHDPQLDVAIEALANAPPPPTTTPPMPLLSKAQLDDQLQNVLPDDVQTNDRLKNGGRWQRLDFVHPNELVDQNGGTPDPLALQQVLRDRGYQGSVLATYGASPGNLPAVSVELDLYASTDGAHLALATNDLPALQVPIDAPLAMGEETTAYRGTWLALGSTILSWRRGRVVITVSYSDVPGYDRPQTVTAIAQVVDGRAQQLAVP